MHGRKGSYTPGAGFICSIITEIPNLIFKLHLHIIDGRGVVYELTIRVGLLLQGI